MPSATQVKFKMIGGLAGSIGRSGPEYVQQSVNWFAHAGTLKKRHGSTPFRNVTAKTTTSGLYLALTTGADPSAVTAVASLPITLSSANCVFLGSDTVFNRFTLNGKGPGDNTTWFDLSRLTTYSLTRGCRFYVHNGTTWVQVYPGTMSPKVTTATSTFVGGYSTSHPEGSSMAAPFCFYSGYGYEGQEDDCVQIDGVMDPPDSWALKTFGGQSKYWMKIETPVVNTNAGAATAISAASISTVENRVLSVLTWQDRNETPHDLIVSMYSDDGKQLRFTLDGTVLTQSVDLQPDGNSRVFGPDQKVDTVYHSGSDRVIGHIQDYGWFYLIPGDGNVYNLPADDQGIDTPYASLSGGLRADLPEANHIAVAEGRIFAAHDQTLRWSVPGDRPDIWPNASVMFMDDGLGPITGMAVVQGSLVVFKRRAIYAVQFNGQDIGSAASDFDGIPVSSNIGAIGGICPAGDTLFFVGEDGFYQFNGKQATRLTTKFDEEFLAGELGVDFSKTKAAYYSPLGQVRFFFPKESSNILDRAVYISAASAIIPGDDDDTETPFSIWPQGRVSAIQPGEYGFQGTAVCADFSGTRPRVLLGDRYGWVWEMDSGFGDAGYPVVAEAFQSEQNYAGGNKILVGPTYLSQNGQVTQGPLSVGVIPNGQVQEKKLINAYPYEVGMGRSYTSFVYTDTCKDSQAGVTKRLNHNVRCHSFGVYIYDAGVSVRDITGFSVDVIPVGNRGL